jgi:hypothetical protein
MSGNHTKREIVTSEKAIDSGRTLSKESGDKYTEESSSSIKSHWKDDKKKKKMKKVVYYKTDSSSPSTSGAESTTPTCHERKKYSKCVLECKDSEEASYYILMVKIIACGVIK